MGREIQIFDDDTRSESTPIAVANLLRETRQLSTTELKEFFEKMFGRMNPSSKEAMTEIMWTGLSQEEQQTFEMPYYGHRWSDASVISALQDAFSRPEPIDNNSRELVIRPGRPANLQGNIKLNLIQELQRRTFQQDFQLGSPEFQIKVLQIDQSG
jgi:hypothetical protein